MSEDNKEILMHAVPADHVTIVENPIKKAFWKDKEYSDGYIETSCSNCGWTYTSMAGWRSYYCPYCGARMREKDKD